MAKVKPGVKKYLVIALFVVASVLSAVFMGRVAINYSISDYLGDSTETKISLDIIEDEFGMTSDIQVMAEGVSVEEAKQIRDTLKDIPDVLNVNFDEYDENYYKNGNALFIVLVDGDEYSESASTVSAEIRAALKEYDGRTSFAGSVTEKQNLKDAITSEMVYILLIAVCLVAALLLLTSRSWLEPIVLLLTSGIAILINMGTNLIFGKISYITNSVAAILQLALSIDYSIVLIHNYRSCKETESDNGKAMRQAVRNVTKPVSASALTTIAGLVALLFMSFKIGFDIGIVLIKGIVISVVTSLTFLPALLLALDKPMQKTKKKEIVLKGGKFCNFAFKANKAVVPVALALIIACGALQSFNTYSFNDTKIDNPAMLETFGQNNSVVVVYPNGANNYEMEAELVRKVSSYRKEDGTAVLKNYTAYTNTVREEYDVEKASRKLELSRSDAELLFTMYHLYKDETRLMLTTESFVSYADELLATDADAAEFADAETADTVASLIAAGTLMNGTHTAEEFHTLVTTGAFEGTDLDLFSVRQMYGLYYYETVENDAADFKTMLTYFIDVSQREEVAPMFDEETVADLQALSAGIAQFNGQMETPMTKADFQGYMYQNYGATIFDEEAATIWNGYFTSKG
ncbi:MAG: efflux RND transporter permease subunit, partial [Candidatus Gallimonas sp.]